EFLDGGSGGISIAHVDLVDVTANREALQVISGRVNFSDVHHPVAFRAALCLADDFRVGERPGSPVEGIHVFARADIRENRMAVQSSLGGLDFYGVTVDIGENKNGGWSDSRFQAFDETHVRSGENMCVHIPDFGAHLSPSRRVHNL